jgi:26S proteasome regulatory subunit N2
MQDDALLAYQIAFDLVENENQAFVLDVQNYLDALRRSSASSDLDRTPATEPAGDVQMTDDATMPVTGTIAVDPNDASQADRLTKIKAILSGEKSIELTLQFLYSHNR